MRLISWNCNGAFRRKFPLIDPLSADLLVIQECEDPAQSTDAAYREWAGNYLWSGFGKSKGIGIFSRNGEAVRRLPWDDGGFSLFLPAQVGDLKIVAVWTQQAKRFAYIGQFWHYLQVHRAAVDADTIVVGDFNSNAIWDEARRNWNHSDVVGMLEEVGLLSLYHRFTGEAQGAETRHTFNLYRHADKPYHIDYIFAHQRRLTPDFSLEIGSPSDWMLHSDHLPLIVDL